MLTLSLDVLQKIFQSCNKYSLSCALTWAQEKVVKINRVKNLASELIHMAEMHKILSNFT